MVSIGEHTLQRATSPDYMYLILTSYCDKHTHGIQCRGFHIHRI